MTLAARALLTGLLALALAPRGALAHDAAPTRAAVDELFGAPIGPLAGEADDASGPAAPPGPAPWIRRFPPTRHMVELGAFIGTLTPPLAHGLVNDAIQADSGGTYFQSFDTVVAAFGARAAYFPSPHLGVELGGGFAPTYTAPLGERADIYSAGARVIAQLGSWSATPYLLAGGGLLGTRGAVGSDVDPALQVGAGVKLALSTSLHLRLEVRDMMAEGLERPLAHYVQASFGLSLTLRRRAAGAPSLARRPGPRRGL